MITKIEFHMDALLCKCKDRLPDTNLNTSTMLVTISCPECGNSVQARMDKLTTIIVTHHHRDQVQGD